MFKRVLVAFDPLKPSPALLEKALAIAKVMGAHLKLLNVLTVEGDGTYLMADPGVVGYSHALNDWNVFQESYHRYQEKSLANLQQLSDQAAAAGVPAEYSQRSGTPGRCICEVAREWDADLVMVGSHGRTGLKELLLGSVSNYVVHHSPCSVMVVHPESREAAPEAAVMAASA